MSFVLLIIGGALAATRPEAAAIIQGAAEADMAESPTIAQLFGLIVTEALGEERARTPRPRRGDGLGPSRRLRPYPDRPSPQRNPIRDSAMRRSPRWTGARSGHSARGELMYVPMPAVSANQLSPAVPRSPTSAGLGPTERDPRSQCIDVTHQVRGRAARRARHRRGHILSPVDGGQPRSGPAHVAPQSAAAIAGGKEAQRAQFDATRTTSP
jgi:hypothetical protein